MINRIFAFIITNILATTLVFAEHTKASVNSDLSRILNAYSNITEGAHNKSNKCSRRNINKLVNKIDARIDKANLSNKTLEESISHEVARYNQVRVAQIKMTKRILKRNRRINRTYKKVRKSNPTLTKSDFVKKLKSSILVETTAAGVASITSALTEAGSMVNYLVDMKDKVLNCNQSEAKLEGFDFGWVWLILFIGLPILTLITSLFAVLFGAFWWALGLFAYTVVGLLVYFIWANVSSLNQNKELEVEAN
jgi:hypothetical protein